MSKAFGYIRVSREEQVESGLSLAAQEQIARDFWQRNLKGKGMEWGGFWADEAVSAFKRPLLRRPSGQKFVTVAQAGDHIIATRFDRCFRSMLDFVNTFRLLETVGVVLHVLDAPGDPNTAHGRAMLQMLCVFAEWESRVKSERVKAAMAILRQQGKHTGGKPPWGYKVVGPKRNRENGTPGDRRLEPDWDERSWMLEVARLRLVEGITCWEEVARRMRQHQLIVSRQVRSPTDAIPGEEESHNRTVARGCWKRARCRQAIMRREWSADSCILALRALKKIVRSEGSEWIEDSALRNVLACLAPSGQPSRGVEAVP